MTLNDRQKIYNFFYSIYCKQQITIATNHHMCYFGVLSSVRLFVCLFFSCQPEGVLRLPSNVCLHVNAE